jgi:4-amino-4-deoxy-L-arabinose transferase-like glycosyltransferase
MITASHQSRLIVVSAELLALGLVVLALRLGDVSRPPITDELYHVLSARSWVADGTFQIADGIYNRAAAFTILVGIFFEIFDESLIVARLPSIAAGTLTILILFVWLRRVAGRQAAWIAALALGLAPMAIFTSLFIRFYSLHALLFLCGTIGIYALGTQRPSVRATSLLLVATLSALGLALHLQVTTIIGLVALVLWLGLQAGLALAKSRPHVFVVTWSIVGLAAIAFGIVVTLTTDSGLAVLESYRWTPLWNAHHREELEYYFITLGRRYPTFFSLFPLAIVFAISRRPAVASLCTVIFVTSFVLLSFGGRKAELYIFFAMPFFFAVWGIALAEGGGLLFKFLRRYTDEATQQLFRISPDSAVLPRLHWSFITLVVAFVMVTNTAFPTGLKMALNPRPVAADWRAIEPTLRPIAEKADVVLTTADITALYFIDRHDIFISATHLSEQEVRQEFALDYRTGRPIISTPLSLRKVMTCYPTGLVIVEERYWLSDLMVSEAIANLLITRAARIDLDEASGIRAYRWDAPLFGPEIDCEDLPKFAGGTAAVN